MNSLNLKILNYYTTLSYFKHKNKNRYFSVLKSQLSDKFSDSHLILV